LEKVGFKILAIPQGVKMGGGMSPDLKIGSPLRDGGEPRSLKWLVVPSARLKSKIPNKFNTFKKGMLKPQ